MTPSALERLRDRLARLAEQRKGTPFYAVPGLWLGPETAPARHLVRPARFLLSPFASERVLLTTFPLSGLEKGERLAWPPAGFVLFEPAQLL